MMVANDCNLLGHKGKDQDRALVEHSGHCQLSTQREPVSNPRKTTKRNEKESHIDILELQDLGVHVKSTLLPLFNRGTQHRVRGFRAPLTQLLSIAVKEGLEDLGNDVVLHLLGKLIQIKGGINQPDLPDHHSLLILREHANWKKRRL